MLKDRFVRSRRLSRGCFGIAGLLAAKLDNRMRRLVIESDAAFPPFLEVLRMNVASILKVKGKSVATARPDETVEAVAQKLAARKIGAIVIVGDGGHVNGIISERDIIRAISSNGASALTLPVGDIMTKNVMSCHEASTLEQMMAVMTQGRFRHVPVIEDGSLVGIISIGDVVKHHIAEVEMEVTAMRDYLATG